MRLIISTILIFFFAACTRSKLADVIDHTSAMEIQFTDTSGNITGIYKTNFSGEINMLNKYFTGAVVQQSKCGSEGKIILKGRDTTEVDFSLQNKCQHISFQLNGNIYTEDVSFECIGYLKKLRFKVKDIKPLPITETKKDTLHSAK